MTWVTYVHTTYAMIDSMAGYPLYVLTVNTGSSSLKAALFFMESPIASAERMFECAIADIGEPQADIVFQSSDGNESKEVTYIKDHSSAIELFTVRLSTVVSLTSIDAVGYRIVHGGSTFSEATVITDDVVNELQKLMPLDPQHAPVEQELIQLLRQKLPEAKHVACFDTAFFHDIPRVAQIVPIPRTYETLGVRRYGFHGLSYTYLRSAFEAQAGVQAANGRVVYAHLGNGVSLSATNNGKATDMTMGFTPTSGVMMGSRSGDLDPEIAHFLTQNSQLSLDDFNHMVGFESGLLGVSGLSSDMYTLLQVRDENPQANEAIELFCYQVKKAIGSLATTIGGIDSLIFSGGMGEQAPYIRQRICDGLEFLGILIDDSANQRHEFLISNAAATVGVHVIPTDESEIIRQQVGDTLASLSTGGQYE